MSGEVCETRTQSVRRSRGDCTYRKEIDAIREAPLNGRRGSSTNPLGTGWVRWGGGGARSTVESG